MENATSAAKANYWAQSNALLRKNLIYQKRNKCQNCCLFVFPVVILVLLVGLQYYIDHQLKELNAKPPIPNPREIPPALQIPIQTVMVVRSDQLPFQDLPDPSCRKISSCPATFLFTASNQSFAQGLVGDMFPTPSPVNASDPLELLVLGTNDIILPDDDNAFPEYSSPLYYLQYKCSRNSSISSSWKTKDKFECMEGLTLWRNSSFDINDEICKGNPYGNAGEMNQFVGAFDLLDSNSNSFNLIVWCKTIEWVLDGSFSLPFSSEIVRLLNMVSNAYLRFLRGASAQIRVEFIKDMPTHNYVNTPNIVTLMSTLLFIWIIIWLFPVMLQALVYEKQHNLRMMMKMHGLGDRAYWTISYGYFAIVSLIYMLCFVAFGSIFGLGFFTMNDYTIQFVFYFVYANLQVSLAFLATGFFSNVKTASVVAYLLVFVTGLLGNFLFQGLLEKPLFPRMWVIALELFPGFSLFRGLYELQQYAFDGSKVGNGGMKWQDLKDPDNGMREVIIIMFVEWFVTVLLAYYIDRVSSSGSWWKRPSSSARRPTQQSNLSPTSLQTKHPDVAQEREIVERSMLEVAARKGKAIVCDNIQKVYPARDGNPPKIAVKGMSYDSQIRHQEIVERSMLEVAARKGKAIVCDNIQKVYPARDGNPPKIAVKGMYLALPQAGCFGMLGPNGAGKSSFISMMIGLTKPTSGTAFINGLDIRTNMAEIYSMIGVCPQDDLLWETLTGREHLLFYGRLKNLSGAALKKAVEDSLKNVNLYYGGVADKQAAKYSGGMKRRLSVAISLIGDPKVVFMDEPSTGLDPASRNNLWNAVKRAKQDRIIILTTHSMEEAEALCDRLGIFVDGSLQCIANAKELKARYGGTLVFTITTSAVHSAEVENMVKFLSPTASKIYHLAGTQKFELLKHQVRLADIFEVVEIAKQRFPVHAWGLADTTLEDVFIKVARDASA